VKYQYENVLEYLVSIVSAAVEGVFILSLLTWMYNSHNEISAYYLPVDQSLPVLRACYNFASLFGLLCMCIFFIASILGDATYRTMSGNSSLTKDLIIDGLDTAGSNISAEFAIDPRLAGLNSNVLHSAAYIYYPTSLMRDESEAKRLRRNTKQVTSTLDFYQTIQGIIGSIDQNITYEGCAKGVDLTSSDIDDDRLVISTNSVSQHGGSLLWALSNKEKALYYRKSKFPSPDLGQGRDSVYVLEFGNCTLNSEAHCIGELNSEGKEVFRTAIRA